MQKNNALTIIGLAIIALLLFVGKAVNYPHLTNLVGEFFIIYAGIIVAIAIVLRYGYWTIPFIVGACAFFARTEISSLLEAKTYTYTNFLINILTHNPIGGLPSGGYPLFVPLYWFLVLYSSQVITNKLFKAKNFGVKKVLSLSIIDGLVMLAFGLFNEAGGIFLNWWYYDPTLIGQNLMGAPIISLYYYFLIGLSVNLALRLSLLIPRKYSKQFFKKSSLNLDGAVEKLFFTLWYFMIASALIIYGPVNWMIAVGVPLATLLFLLANKALVF